MPCAVAVGLWGERLSHIVLWSSLIFVFIPASVPSTYLLFTTDKIVDATMPRICVMGGCEEVVSYFVVRWWPWVAKCDAIMTYCVDGSGFRA